jgi:hypothetical protein
MLLSLMRARLRVLVMSLALIFAAPRVTGWLRQVGDRQHRRDWRGLATQAPARVAQALETAARRGRDGLRRGRPSRWSRLVQRGRKLVRR